MAKYDVELITDKHGKPMPQYFDEVEKKMKPITKDNFDGTINGSVDVEFPDVQKVEVTNPTEFPAELNVNVNNPVDTVSVDNLPDVQRVEVTNAQEQLDVNVLNPVDNVSVNNLPNDYPDQAVEARLQAIEQTQSQILNKLNDTIDTRLTGSNMEYDKSTKFISRVGVIASGVSETLLEVRKPVAIHEFTAFFDKDDARFRAEMEVYDGVSWAYYELATSPTAKGRAIIPSRADNSALFTKVKDENLIKLVRPLSFRGVRFRVVNVTNEDRNISIAITYDEENES